MDTFVNFPPPDATVSLTAAAYTGIEGTHPFSDVCVKTDTPGIFVANLMVTANAMDGNAGYFL